jgi:hypothetical protein
MTTHPRVDFDAVHDQLRAAVRYGVRADQLKTHSPTLIDLLCPSSPDTAATLMDRAVITEQIISDAVSALDPPTDEAMRIMLCLAPGTHHVGVEKRRARAALLLGIQAGTFRRPHREGAFLLDLAVEIVYRRSA